MTNKTNDNNMFRYYKAIDLTIVETGLYAIHLNQITNLHSYLVDVSYSDNILGVVLESYNKLSSILDIDDSKLEPSVLSL